MEHIEKIKQNNEIHFKRRDIMKDLRDFHGEKVRLIDTNFGRFIIYFENGSSIEITPKSQNILNLKTNYIESDEFEV